MTNERQPTIASDGAALLVATPRGREHECTVRPRPPIVGYLVLAFAWVACIVAITIWRPFVIPAADVAAFLVPGASSALVAFPFDLVALALATHQLSRVLAKERIALPIRRLFTYADGETPRDGWRRAPAELVTCPYCASVWSATALVALQSRTVTYALAFAAVASLAHAWRDR